MFWRPLFYQLESKVFKILKLYFQVLNFALAHF